MNERLIQIHDECFLILIELVLFEVNFSVSDFIKGGLLVALAYFEHLDGIKEIIMSK